MSRNPLCTSLHLAGRAAGQRPHHQRGDAAVRQRDHQAGAAAQGRQRLACTPTAAHPRPVVLVHGLGANMGMNWSYLSPKLKERGYCVFALTYGLHPLAAPFGAPGGTIPIQDSAKELKTFVDRVLRETGAAEVDLVGHSEGTFMPQYYLKFLGGAAVVKRYVAWTPLYDGTRLLRLDSDPRLR